MRQDEDPRHHSERDAGPYGRFTEQALGDRYEVFSLLQY